MSKSPSPEKIRSPYANPAFLGYTGLTSGLFLMGLPYVLLYSKLTRRYRNSMRQRIGLFPYPDMPPGRSPRIWLHAVSMGEVTAAVPIIEALRAGVPGAAIILSTTTEHGQALAKARLPDDVVRIYAPVDFLPTVRTVLKKIEPDILVCLETEIWPNWLITAHRLGIRTAIVNGRISARTFSRYRMIRPLMKEVLDRMSVFSMIQEIDALRIRELGAAPEKIRICGNAKYDLLIRQSSGRVRRPDPAGYWRTLFSIQEHDAVFLAGSTRHAEEDVIIDAYLEIRRHAPRTLLIMAPRHLERVRHIEKIIQEKGLRCQLRSGLGNGGAHRTAPVVILDTMGELSEIYSIATVVFCGGSLAPLGGQNILEPAVWGKPVLYGPHMDDFLDARRLMESTGGGTEVRNGSELADKALFFISHPDAARKTGGLARTAVEMNEGAAQKHADVICRLLPGVN